ncbi:unnamed protein product [Discula destructiva]
MAAAATIPPPQSFDYVIVGGGTAGLVLAARLTEDPEVQVLVLEAGEDLQNDQRVNVPAMWMQLLGTSADWAFKTSPQNGLGGREMNFSQGHLLGGSSALNSMNFVVSAKSNLEQWEALGNPGWDGSIIPSAMHKVYSLHGAANLSQADQGNGSIQATVPVEDSRWPELWRKTIAASGFPADNSPVSATISGAVSYPDTVDPKTATRSYAVTAYLNSAGQRANLVVQTSALVDKILFSTANSSTDGSGPIATGVQYSTVQASGIQVAARKEVILSAGTFNSPRILETSGIGDAALLNSLDVSVVVDNAFVGENLQNHLVVPLSFETVEGDGLHTIDDLSRGDSAALAAAAAAFAKQSGPLSRSNGNVMAHLPFPNIATDTGKQELEKLLDNVLQSSSGATKTTTAYDKQLKLYVQSVLRSTNESSSFYITVPGWASYKPDGNPAAIPPGNETYFSIPVLLAHPLSRGSTHITSDSITSSRSSGVDINPNYLAHPLDLEILARHVQFVESSLAITHPLASALNQSSSAKRSPDMPAGPAGFAGDDGLGLAREYVRKTAVGAYHFVGTCSMLPREKGGVVDPELRVYGVRGLRVVDASVIPLATSANTMATVYSLAERAAEIIKSGV